METPHTALLTKADIGESQYPFETSSSGYEHSGTKHVMANILRRKHREEISATNISKLLINYCSDQKSNYYAFSRQLRSWTSFRRTLYTGGLCSIKYRSNNHKKVNTFSLLVGFLRMEFSILLIQSFHQHLCFPDGTMCLTSTCCYGTSPNPQEMIWRRA